MSLVKNNPISNYEKWINLKLSTIPKKHYEEAALLLIRLFRSATLLQLQEAKAFPVEFTKVVFFQLARFWEIQSGLKANLSTQEILLHKKNVKLWLQTQRTFMSVVRPEELWNQEVVSSYMILNFPFQETCLRKTCHVTQEVTVTFWENELIESEELLYQYFDQNREEVFSDKEKLRLHRLLHFNCALFEENKKVDWLQVIADWFQSDEERKENADALLSALAAPFSLAFDFPKPNKDERKRAEESVSFQDYVITRTIHSVEKYFGYPFSDKAVQEFTKAIVKTLSVRHDLTFFSHHREALIAYNRKQERCSNFFVRNFQLYAAYSPFLEIYSSDHRQLFFDLIFLSQMENDYSLQLAQYLPQRLTNLSQRTFDQAWSAIRPYASRMDWTQESQLIYILGFFIEHRVQNKDLLLSTLRPLEIFKFYKKNQPTRDNRAAVYPRLSNEAPKANQKSIQEKEEHLAEKSIEIFEHEIRKISDNFTFEQKSFLFALFEEEKFEKFLRFLQNLCSAIKKPLQADLAFHFLMSDFDAKKSSTAREEIFTPLNDALLSIEKVLAKEKINQEKLVSLFGKLFIQIATLSNVASHILTSEFEINTSSTEKEEIFKSLNDASVSIKKELAKEKINQEKLVSLFGELFVQLSTVFNLVFHVLMSNFEINKSTTTKEEIFKSLNDASVSIKKELAKEKISQERLASLFGELFVQISTLFNLAFHFLMSDFEIKTNPSPKKKIFNPLKNTLFSIKEVLAKEKSNQEKLVSFFGELFVQLSTVSKDFDQNTICSELQLFLFKVFKI